MRGRLPRALASAGEGRTQPREAMQCEKTASHPSMAPHLHTEGSRTSLAIEVARQHKMLQQLRQDLTVAYTIAATVEEMRQRLETEDPDIQSALHRIEGAVHILTHMAETEAPLDV